MKKMLPQIKPSFSRCCIMLIILLSAFYSCKKDLIIKSESERTLLENNVDLTKLKDVYQQATQKLDKRINSTNQRSIGDIVGSLNVDWTTYYLQELADSTKVIEFDMPNDTTLAALANVKIGDPAKYLNKTKVVFMLKKDTLKRAFFMKEIEDLNGANSVSVLENLHYMQIPRSFTGKIIYLDLEKKFINGWTWSKGNIEKTIALSSHTQSNQQIQYVGPKTNVYQLVCKDVQVVTLTIEMDYDTSGGYLPYIFLYQTVEYATECNWEGTFGASGGGGVGDSGGSTGGGGLPTIPNPCPNSISFVKGQRVNATPCQTNPPPVLPPDDSPGDSVEGSTTDEMTYVTDPNLDDPSWWESSIENYPPQNLPSYATMYLNYPKVKVNGVDRDMPSDQVYKLIGGPLLDDYNSNPSAYGNACAARISRALLYSGITIPYIPNKTHLGGDGKYYFISAAALFNWMSKTFGKVGPLVKTFDRIQGGTNGVNFPGLLSGNKGIYILRPVSVSVTTGFGATGHATLFNGSNCIINSHGQRAEYFNARGGVELIRLWILN